MTIVLQIENLSKYFFVGKQEYLVLNNFNLQVEEGEFFCIVGPSGCGKSTLLRQIAGFDRDNCLGRISINGNEISRPGADRIMVFQDDNQLFPWKTVFENVIFPLKVKKGPSTIAEKIERANYYLQLVQLKGFENNYPYQLSGGMKQRAAIARSLVLEPKILLMDEPFGSLDAQARGVLQEILLDIWLKTGVTIVFVTHDIQEAILLSSRIMVMGKKGRIINIFSNPIERPRTPQNAGFADLVQQIFNQLEL
ncbi:MAG: ABC transporter ATP-binding protein [Dehalobacterium sp.]